MTVNVDEPNDLFRVARLRLSSPRWPSRRMSRQELADAVAAKILKVTGRHDYVDAQFIGRVERGQLRWPGADRRNALRAVLGVESDAQLGLFITRRGRDDDYARALDLPPPTAVPAEVLPSPMRGDAVARAGTMPADSALRVTVRGDDLAGVYVVVYVAAEIADRHDQLVVSTGGQTQVYSLVPAPGTPIRLVESRSGG